MLDKPSGNSARASDNDLLIVNSLHAPPPAVACNKMFGSMCHETRRHDMRHCLNVTQYPSSCQLYIYGEVTSQSLWSRYDCYFVGITRYNALS